ncbi:MAG: hypothetical protein ACFE9X_06930 [Promethearchaeota archaeon]
MNNAQHQEKNVFLFRIVQSGENIVIPLTDKNLKSQFKEIYHKLLKKLRLKQNDVYLSNKKGMMVANSDLGLSLQDIIKKFGSMLKLYYEKIF